MAAKRDKEALSAMLGVRVSTDDLARLDALVERLPIGMRHGIARFAFRVGLEAIEKGPALLLGALAEKRRGKR
jgi:hypothetical protein